MKLAINPLLSRPLAVFRRHRSAAARRARERGFTLVEVLVAMLILTGGLVAVAQLLAMTIRMHQLARNTAEATRLADAKFEELMKLNFAAAPAVQVSAPAPDPLEGNVANYFDVPTNTGSSNVYTRRWRVQAGPTATTRLVTVRIVPGQSSVLTFRIVELTTLIRQW